MNFQIAEFKAAYGKSTQIPPSEKPEIVFSGKSNVGKSSLINKLLNRKSMARVSAKPGKTATINFFSLKDADLVDLPGYGYAQVSQAEKKRWAELVEGYLAQDRKIALVVQICDMRHTPTENDMTMIEYLYNSGLNFIIALTKMDKLKKTQQQKRLEELHEELSAYSGLKLFPCSSNDGSGIEEIRRAIEQAVAECRTEE
ncbi:MAG: YihA family ribosome biogenesis GTP-binding protein [Clostridia bacterium]|nr:YihA family ribosome biogenesis GTP-binding protein [Clostridia bacterium]